MSTVRVDFQVGGIRDVQNAFRTVQEAASLAARSSQRGASDNARTLKGKAKAEVDASRVADRESRVRERIAAKESSAKIKAAERTAREEIRLDRQVAREKERSMAHVARIRDRHFAQEQKQREREARDAGKFRRAISGASSRAIQAGASVPGRIATAGVGLLGMLGGGFAIASSLGSNIGLRGDAAQLVASADKSNAANKGLTTDSILGSARAVAIQSGFDSKEVMAGFGAIKDLSGNLGQAIAVMPQLATMANATGGNLSELAGSFGEIVKSNQNISNEDALKLMAVQAAQGQKGAVELKDFAQYGGRVVSAATLNEGDAIKNIAGISASMQLARQYGSATDAPEAALAGLRLNTDLIDKADKIRSITGVNVKSKDGKMLRAQEDIVQELIKATGGNLFKLGSLKIGDRGEKVLQGAAAVYNQAGGGKAGEKALADFYAKMTAGLSVQELQNAAAQRTAEIDKQVAINMEKLSQAVGSQLLPEIIKVMPELVKLVPLFGKALGTIAPMIRAAVENPMLAAGVVISAEMTKLALSAGGAASGLGLVAVAAGLAMAAYMKLTADLEKTSDKRKDSVAQAGKANELASEAERKIKAGQPLSDVEITALREQKTRTDLAAANMRGTINGSGRSIAEELAVHGAMGVDLVTGSTVVKDEMRNDRQNLDRTAAAAERLQKALDMAAEAATRSAGGGKPPDNVSPTASNRNVPMNGGATQ